jgi:mono/diheme cytochrome c family protein
MRSRTFWIVFVLIALAIAGVAAFLMRFNLSALEGPGYLETSIANRGKRFLIRRASRQEIPAPPKDKKASIAAGDMLYGVDCSMCHGRDGHAATDMGRWMYPRAVDLTSADVQAYSDRELFWIIKNGIRLSGMPAFGRVESDEHIWNLVDYLRTMPQHSQKKTQ